MSSECAWFVFLLRLLTLIHSVYRLSACFAGTWTMCSNSRGAAESHRPECEKESVINLLFVASTS